jgi:hypothetical protein
MYQAEDSGDKPPERDIGLEPNKRHNRRLSRMAIALPSGA